MPSSQSLPDKHLEDFHAISPVAPVKATRSGLRKMASGNQFIIQVIKFLTLNALVFFIYLIYVELLNLKIGFERFHWSPCIIAISF